jgi:hypothetical protein
LTFMMYQGKRKQSEAKQIEREEKEKRNGKRRESAEDLKEKENQKREVTPLYTLAHT